LFSFYYVFQGLVYFFQLLWNFVRFAFFWGFLAAWICLPLWKKRFFTGRWEIGLWEWVWGWGGEGT